MKRKRIIVSIVSIALGLMLIAQNAKPRPVVSKPDTDSTKNQIIQTQNTIMKEKITRTNKSRPNTTRTLEK